MNADVGAHFLFRLGVHPFEQVEKVDQRRTVGLDLEHVGQAFDNLGVDVRIFFMHKPGHVGFHHCARNRIGGSISQIRELSESADQRHWIGRG